MNKQKIASQQTGWGQIICIYISEFNRVQSNNQIPEYTALFVPYTYLRML